MRSPHLGTDGHMLPRQWVYTILTIIHNILLLQVLITILFIAGFNNNSFSGLSQVRSHHLTFSLSFFIHRYMYHPTEDGLSRWMAARPSSGSFGHCSAGHPWVQWMSTGSWVQQRRGPSFFYCASYRKKLAARVRTEMCRRRKGKAARGPCIYYLKHDCIFLIILPLLYIFDYCILMYVLK